jgi:hypothetical protein
MTPSDQAAVRAEMDARLADDDLNLCSCGSGKEREELNDARGIFVAYVCSKCEKKVKAKYRPEIFTGAYYADELIEPEDY